MIGVGWSRPRPLDDYFGFSVAISGNNVVVGTPGDDAQGSFTGTAYVFGLP